MRTQPFTAPMEIPFTKYFWKKGYTSTIGMVTTIIVAARMDTVEIRAAALLTAAEPTVASDISFLILSDWIRMFRRTICRV